MSSPEEEKSKINGNAPSAQVQNKESGIGNPPITLNTNAKLFVPKNKANQDHQITVPTPNKEEDKNICKAPKPDEKDCKISPKKETSLNPNAGIYVPKTKHAQGQATNRPMEYDPNGFQQIPYQDYYNGCPVYPLVYPPNMQDPGPMEEPGIPDSPSDYDPMSEFVDECKDCSCCQGWVYSCSGEACKYLDKCFCKVKIDTEEAEKIKEKS
jgi:hypothetical protein